MTQESDNVVPLPRREPAPRQPIINLPPVTKTFLAVFIGVHVLIHVILNPAALEWAFFHLGFIPGRFTGRAGFEGLALLTPFSHMAVHGSWIHLAMNGVMMAAFGSGVERWMGGRRMAIFFILCGLCGAAAHFALSPFSIQPVVGASGGISGLFAAAILLMRRSGGNGSANIRDLLPFILLWVGVSIAFGLAGGPGGSPVAWAAHVGGFLGGFAILKAMRV